MFGRVSLVKMIVLARCLYTLQGMMTVVLRTKLEDTIHPTHSLDSLDNLKAGLQKCAVYRSGGRHARQTPNYSDAARLLYNLPRRAYAKPLLRELPWLPIRQRAKFKGLCIAHKARYGNAPEYIKDRLVPYVPGHTVRSSEAYLLSCLQWKKSSIGG